MKRVIIVAGQSNGLGVGSRVNLLPQMLQRPQPKALLWNQTTWLDLPSLTQWLPLQPPTWQLGNQTGFGPELSLAYNLVQATGEEIRIVKIAQGNTSLAVDWRAGNGRLYQLLVARVRTVQAQLRMQGETPELVGIFWMQGESDMFRADWAGAYPRHFRTLITSLRRDLDTPNLPFITALPSTPYPYMAQIRAAQLAVSRQLPQVGVTDTQGLPLLPDGHFSELGQVQLGNRFARAWQTQTRTAHQAALGDSSPLPASTLTPAPTGSATFELLALLVVGAQLIRPWLRGI